MKLLNIYDEFYSTLKCNNFFLPFHTCKFEFKHVFSQIHLFLILFRATRGKCQKDNFFIMPLYKVSSDNSAMRKSMETFLEKKNKHELNRDSYNFHTFFCPKQRT